MFIRQERSFTTGSYIASTAIDITTYDKAARFNGTKMTACPNNAIPQGFFTESADENDPVGVAFPRGVGELSLKLKGSGSAGNKLLTDSSGNIIASATAANAALGTWDFGIALADWTDGAETNCLIMRGSN